MALQSAELEPDGVTMSDELTYIFEETRRTLEGLAYRMLGSLAEAQDVVQDTYLRWQRVELATIDQPRAWLITVCSRLSLNVLNSARRKRVEYVGTWLPEPLLADAPNDVADQLEIDESVSVALLVALEQLTPPQRACYLLHDVFECDFAYVAAVLDLTEANCRKLASRARSRIRSAGPGVTASAAEHQRLLAGFIAAVQVGDLDALQTIFADSVKLYADGGGKVEATPNILKGSRVTARFLIKVWADMATSGTDVDARSVWFNGSPGLLIKEDGAIATAITFDVADGVVQRMYAVRNPDKLVAFS